MAKVNLKFLQTMFTAVLDYDNIQERRGAVCLGSATQF
jgi:hypothetical protein